PAAVNQSSITSSTLVSSGGGAGVNPKFFHTSHFSSRISAVLLLHHPNIQRSSQNLHQPPPLASTSMMAMRGVPAYFQISTGLIKPSDHLEILIMKPVHPQDAQRRAEEGYPNNANAADDDIEETNAAPYYPEGVTSPKNGRAGSADPHA